MNMHERNELLIRLDERTERLETWASNHDHAHLRYNIMAWGVALTAIAGLIIALLTL